MGVLISGPSPVIVIRQVYLGGLSVGVLNSPGNVLKDCP